MDALRQEANELYNFLEHVWRDSIQDVDESDGEWYTRKLEAINYLPTLLDELRAFNAKCDEPMFEFIEDDDADELRYLPSVNGVWIRMLPPSEPLCDPNHKFFTTWYMEPYKWTREQLEAADTEIWTILKRGYELGYTQDNSEDFNHLRCLAEEISKALIEGNFDQE